jgi:hypothetical protein
MIDVVGVVKITDPQREIYHGACVSSLSFVRHTGDFIIYNGDTPNYGKAYIHLLEQCYQPFVLNYIEDAFVVLDDRDTLFAMLSEMTHYSCDVMKASFHKIELNSLKALDDVTETEYGYVYENTKENHDKYCSYYGLRYWLGVNMITTRSFALRFWDRTLGHRPHGYEFEAYNSDFHHRVYIPKIEIIASIDDDHGEPNTALLNRHDPKFMKIMSNL